MKKGRSSASCLLLTVSLLTLVVSSCAPDEVKRGKRRGEGDQKSSILEHKSSDEGLGFADMGQPVGLDALWSREAMFVEDKGWVTPSGFRFPAFAQTSMQLDPSWLNNFVYITDQAEQSSQGGPKSGVGRAEMPDGVHLSLKGLVVPAEEGEDWASFPSIWRDDDGLWLMVFERTVAGALTEIGLATSSDGGVKWDKHDGTFYKAVDGNPHMKCGIGTPSLYKVNGRWFLYFHAFNCHDVQIMLATSSSLGGPWVLENGGNPVLPTGPDVAQAAGDAPIDSGTTGRRNIIEQNGFYYMTYEVSEDFNYCLDKGATRADDKPCAKPGFHGVNWSSAIARSTDLVHWDRNPTGVRGIILPPIYKGFGNDGPTFGPGPNGRVYVYYRVWDNSTRRAALVIYDAAILAVYRHYLGRDPDAATQAAHKAALQNGTQSFDDFVAQIKGTPEAQARPTVNNPTSWGPQPTPAPTPAPVAVARQWSQLFHQLWFPTMGSHLFTAGLAECTNGCNMLGEWFRALPVAPELHECTGNVVSLYRAAILLGDRWVFDLDLWNGGYESLAKSGWQAQGPVANILCKQEPGTYPLYKFINPTNADRYYALTPEVPPGYNAIGPIGWVLPPNAQPAAVNVSEAKPASPSVPAPQPAPQVPQTPPTEPTPSTADVARAQAVPIYGGFDARGWNFYSASEGELSGRQGIGVRFRTPLNCAVVGGTQIVRASFLHQNMGHIFDYDTEAAQAALCAAGWHKDGPVFCVLPSYPGTVPLYKCIDPTWANRFYSTSATCPAGMSGPFAVGNVYPP